jgi:hypothetical protein
MKCSRQHNLHLCAALCTNSTLTLSSLCVDGWWMVDGWNFVVARWGAEDSAAPGRGGSVSASQAGKELRATACTSMHQAWD